MNVKTYLRDLEIGSRGRIVGYDKTRRGYIGKLLSMGLRPGTEFTLIRHAYLGQSVEIEIQGFNLSLRNYEADALCVEEVNDELNECLNVHLDGDSNLS